MVVVTDHFAALAESLLPDLARWGIVLSLGTDGQPRARHSDGSSLTATEREVLANNRDALLAHLMERDLWRLGRLAQAGDQDAGMGYAALLKRYEAHCGEAVATLRDVVVTVPKALWDEWLDEGDLPGEPWDGMESHFWLGGPLPQMQPGDRVYIGRA